MPEPLRRSPVLQKGDLVRLISPASFPDRTQFESYIQALQNWGLRCDTGDHVLCQHGYMAGTDDQRLEDLNNAFRDPDVRAIVTTRGGAGAYRIADDIDFMAVDADPKPMLGFSDITSLQLALFNRCNLGTADRYLTQLQRSGSLNGLNGVVLGSFEIFRDFTDRSWTIIDVLNDHFERWQVPVLGGIFAGHDLSDQHGNSDQYSLPLGAHAEIDVREGTLRVQSIMR